MPAVGMGDMAFLDAFMSVIQDMGDLSAHFKESYSDGEIDNQEYDEIEQDVMRIQQRLLSFLEMIKEIKNE